MSAFGDNYIKNDLNDNIQMFFKDGGTIEEMFDVLKYVFEFGQTPIDKLQQENQELKKQLDYLRSGEYYNQLRFENEMLQQVVDTNGVPSEVYDYIDCTHRNTELLKENQELKEDISFCLHSIKQEMEMSTDSRTRSEMTSCYEILRKWNK